MHLCSCSSALPSKAASHSELFRPGRALARLPGSPARRAPLVPDMLLPVSATWPPVFSRGPRACWGQWSQAWKVDIWRTCAPNCHICLLGSVHVQIRCVMIWQSGVDELGITETRPPAPRRPTGRPYGRRRAALNSSSSLLTLLLARPSFLMNPCFHLCRSEDSALVIPHVSHCFISPLW